MSQDECEHTQHGDVHVCLLLSSLLRLLGSSGRTRVDLGQFIEWKPLRRLSLSQPVLCGGSVESLRCKWRALFVAGGAWCPEAGWFP